MPTSVKQKTSPRLDDFDRDEHARMIASEPFKRYTQRIHEMLERARTACERESDPTKLHAAQGEVTAYRTVLNLPEILKAEIARAKVNAS